MVPVESRTIMPDNTNRETFGRWLLAQRDRGDAVDALAVAARFDPAFPKDGDPEAVRVHLRMRLADGEVLQAVDAAAADWQNVEYI